MSQKKMRAVRKLAKAMGHYKKEPDYEIKETKKMVYGLDKDGKPMAYEVKKYTLINKNRTVYKQMKKAYLKGELDV